MNDLVPYPAPRPTTTAVRERRDPLRSDGSRTVTPEVLSSEKPRRVLLEERITIVRRWLVTEAA